MSKNPKLLVAIPCYNEAVTIVKVIEDFKAVLPDADIHVFDNNSTDGSSELAAKAGANVHRVPQQGKGHVVRAILDKLDSDAVLMVDGDDTYFAEDALQLLVPVLNGEVDMAVGDRLPSADDMSMVRLHQFGNRWIVRLINWMFGTRYKDVLSGYRVFSRRFLESVPVLTSGFEIETELTLQALAEGMSIVEIPVNYRARPDGSESKLHPWRDGYRIMLTAAIILRDRHPLRVWSAIGIILGLLAFGAGALRLINVIQPTGLTNSILSGIILLLTPLSFISFGVGFTLNAINTRFVEFKQILRRNNNRS